MSEEGVEESVRIYTIPLGRVTIVPKTRRAEKAIMIIREFAKKHMKSEDVKISTDLNLMVWRRGSRTPPRRVTVKMEKDEEGAVLVSPFKGGVEAEPEDEEEGGEEGGRASTDGV